MINNIDNSNKSSGFAGTLRNIQLTDIIQMCCLAGTSICIRVSQDQNYGLIYIKEGEIIHSECGEIEGIDAFFSILRWKKGVFETLDFSNIDKKTIKEPCQFLLMEAARLSDEIETFESLNNDNSIVEKLKVLIVDDSPVMSKIISSMLTVDQSIDVINCAKNGEEALRIIRTQSPDIITMDVNMPIMDGSTALKHIMIESPCPVMIMSNLGEASYSTILNFMNLGAVDFMSKPIKNKNIILQQQRMVERIHISAKAKVKRFRRIRFPKIDASKYALINENTMSKKLIIINSGVGGYLEMVNMIANLPCDGNTTIVSIQSIPPLFAPVLASFLNVRTPYDVTSFENRSLLCSNRCYICSGGIGLRVKKNAEKKYLVSDVNISNQEESNENFDNLIESALKVYAEKVFVILLSGADLGTMKSLKEVKRYGGKIVTPQLASCILPATLQPVVDQGLITNMFNQDNFTTAIKEIFN